MTFRLPSGLQAVELGQFNTDKEVLDAEDQQPSSSMMLVALVFPSRWPGFGTSADLADIAARGLSGLRAWPESSRVITPDDEEPVWWVTWLSSPGWFLLIIAAAAALIAFSVAIRIAWVVLPEEARGGLEAFANIVPIMVLAMLMTFVTPMISGLKAQPKGVK